MALRNRLIECLIIIGLGLTNFIIIHSLNLYAVKDLNEGKRMYGVFINGIDTEYYKSQVDNYFAGNGWRKSPPVGNGSYYRRTPGASLPYFACRLLAGDEANGLRMLFVLHCALFIASILALHQILLMLKFNPSSRWLIELFYVCTPYFCSYLGYIYSEAYSVLLLLFYYYFCLRGYNEKRANWKLYFYALSGLVMACAILTRPVTGLAGFILVGYLTLDYLRKEGFVIMFQRSLIIALAPLSLTGIWTVRNYIVTGDLVPLEVAYHPENLDRMRPVFHSYWNFVKSWGEAGSKMNDYHIQFFYSALSNEPADKYIDFTLASWPSQVVKHFGRERLARLLADYYRQINEDLSEPFAKLQAPKSYWSESELRIAKEFDSLRAEYIAAFPLQHYVKTPFSFLRELVLHSNTSNLFFLTQGPLRAKFGFTLYRLSLAFLHILIYILFFVNIIIYPKDKLSEYIAFCITPLVALLFFIFFYQSVEQRYMLPFLMFIVLGIEHTFAKLTHLTLSAFNGVFSAGRNKNTA